MSPDLYSGSYDFTNPQSFDRYSYVTNSPLSMSDPEGLFEQPGGGGGGGGGGGCDLTCQLITLGIDDLINWLEGGGGPKFTGSLKKRPNGQPWDEYHIHWWDYATLASALGLPDAGCEFGACGNIGSTFMPGAATAPLTWCGEHPTICTAGADLLAFARAIPAVAASALLLNMKGEQGGASNYPFTFWKSVGELAGLYDFYSNLWHVGDYHANAHQVTYEDWCGPGGAGPNLSGHDAG